ncbi:MAG: ROK family protein [Anaerolineales bacterium]
MNKTFNLKAPKYIPPLDPAFRPSVLANRAYLDEVRQSKNGVPLLLGLERLEGYISHFETHVFPEKHERSEANLAYVERIVKFLLWQRGGWKVYVGGPSSIGKYLETCYAQGGIRSFDSQFMGEEVYEKPFTVITCDPSQVPAEKEGGKPLGGHLDGCRIGFDLGASDRKVSAVIDGNVIFSEEVIWDPKGEHDPEYHYYEVMSSLKKAAEYLPRVDAIGGSAAGIYIDNQVRIASLFRGIPKDRYHEVRKLFIRIRDEFGVPLEIVNDGDVTALAGSLSIEDNGVLGIAMGSSEAGGYVDMHGNITGWLNELAFAPVDYNPEAPVDEWSGDRGVGAQYFSQECIFRLATKAGIKVPSNLVKAEQLVSIQEKLEAGDKQAELIWKSMGYYLGYSLAHYADFYDLKHVLILGRCTSGRGGNLILAGANEVIEDEFSTIAEKVSIQLPDEKSRRIGQSIAAASLPALEKEM